MQNPLDRVKNPKFWAAVLGVVAGYLAGQSELPEAIKSLVDAIFQ